MTAKFTFFSLRYTYIYDLFDICNAQDYSFYNRTDRTTVMTSATWPENVRRLADKYMTDPATVFVGKLEILFYPIKILFLNL